MSGANRQLTYEYDPGSRRTSLAFPDGVGFTYGYDPAGRLTEIREGVSTAVTTFTYDTGLRPWQALQTGATTTYGYDPISRLGSIGHDLSSTPADQTLTFTYTPASQIATRNSANDAYASTSAANGSRAYSVNRLNQYTVGGAYSYLYDGNGNLRSDGSRTFVYDAENRMVSMSGSATASLTYDPLGRLFQIAGSAGTTQFLYDGDELIAEYNGSGTLLRRYVHGLGVDDPVLWYEGATLATRRSLFADHQGSIVAVANASGAMLAINGYDAWGVPNSGNQGRFQYTGQAWLPELGMYYYKARLYSAVLGRFLQTDPVGYEDQVNLYAYVGNDPVNMGDPAGESGEEVASANTETCPNSSAQPTPRRGCPGYRIALAAGGAVVGGIIGAGAGGTGGGAAGALCGPGAPACVPAGAAVGAVEGAALGVAIGGAVGGLLGAAIDHGIAVFRGDRAPRANEGQATTTPGARLPQRTLNQTTDQVRRNLSGRGFEGGRSADGRAEIYRLGNTEFVIRPSTSSPSGFKIDLRVRGRIVRQYVTQPN